MSQIPVDTPKKGITLSRLTARLRDAVQSDPSLQGQWVVAEIVEARASGGHVYLDLAEKDDKGVAKAKMRATIWASTARQMSLKYGPRLRQIICVGSEVLLYGSVAYSPVYSLAFSVTDIDPDYVRDTNRLQAQILATITAEGLLDENKGLELPMAVQRIAVISAQGAAGYGDFCNQLLGNPYRLRFYPVLFPSVMQGAGVSAGIRAALNDIELRQDEFDCVVIIRGGGATADLAGFDELLLARAVALFPLPVIVGIGHERDNTVLDFIAHTRVKTPTAAAEFLIARNAAVLSRIGELATAVRNFAENALEGERRQLEFYKEKLPLLARGLAEGARARLSELGSTLPLMVRNRMQEAGHRLAVCSRAIESAGRTSVATASARLQNARTVIERDLQVIMASRRRELEALQDKVTLLSPRNVLARGYSITRVNGCAVTDPSSLTPGQQLTTTLLGGTVISTINETK